MPAATPSTGRGPCRSRPKAPRPLGAVAPAGAAPAEEGGAAAEQANAAMVSVRESSSAVSDAINELAAKSGQIGAIVETITALSGQTNLLALNAAIEAAR